MKKFALLGHDIAYSQSPRLHQMIGLAVNEECQYDLVDVKGNDLEATVKRLCKEYDGFNITKPYKEVILKRELLDVVAPVAIGLGCVNTVAIDKGLSTGYNTDNFGFFQAWKMNEVKADKGWKCLILGAGGGARAVASVLRTSFEITVCNRSPEHAQDMLKCMMMKEDAYVTPDQISADDTYEIVINATTLGLNGENCTPEKLNLSKSKVCMDLIYEPSETPFMTAAKAAGVEQVFNGRWMLISQAIAAQQIWREKNFEPEQLKEIFLAMDSMF